MARSETTLLDRAYSVTATLRVWHRVPSMRPDQRRAAQLWRDLIDCCKRAVSEPADGLSHLEVGFIMHEFAVGLIAVGLEKEAIMTYSRTRSATSGATNLQ